MIVSGLFGVFMNVLNFILGLVGDVVSLPLDLMQGLSNFFYIGDYIIGTDLIAVFCASVLFWSVVKLSVGVGLWIWDLLPLT